MIPQRKFNLAKICMVPECKNNSHTTPNKLFTCVPQKKEVRDLWIESVTRNSSLSIRKASRHCCEDHFNLQEDMENYIYFKLMHKQKNGSLRMKPGVVPHIFDCCKNKKLGVNGTKTKAIEQDKADKLIDVDISCIVQEDCQQNQVLEGEATMAAEIIPLNTDEKLLENKIKIVEVHSVTQELENFINFEIDDDELVEESNVMSEDFLQSSVGDLDDNEEIYHFEEIQEERNVQDQQIDESREDEVMQELGQDSDDNTFEEGINNFEGTETQIAQQELIDIISDDENTNVRNAKDSEDINMKFLNNKELDDCIVVDLSNEAEEQTIFTLEEVESYAEKESSEINQEFSDENEVNVRSLQEGNDSDDCIVISEDENSSEMGDMGEMNITSENPIFSLDMSNEKSSNLDVEKEITENDILQEFKIVEEQENGDENIALERLEDPKKIIVRQRNGLYSCPLYCTFLSSDRKRIIEHLISHKKKMKLQQEKCYRCPVCPYNSACRDFFVNHLMDHKEPYFACKKCQYVTSKFSTFKAHMHVKHGTSMTCDNCRFKAKTLINYLPHQMRCRSLTRIENTAERHRLTKFKDDLRCHFDPCPFTAASEEALKTHEWIQHQIGSNNIKKFKCYIDYCNVETFREDIFQEHLNAHPSGQLQCKQCSYRTLDWQRFIDHVIKHVIDADI